MRRARHDVLTTRLGANHASEHWTRGGILGDCPGWVVRPSSAPRWCSHTWTRTLEYHPHVHAIVTGGGLSRDGTRWRPAARRFLFAVHALSRVLRGKMMTELGRAHDRNTFRRFDDFRDPTGFVRLMARIAGKSWNVYAKAPFHRGRHVLAYLGRYTHRVGIANSRLLAVSERAVTFRTKVSGPKRSLRASFFPLRPSRTARSLSRDSTRRPLRSGLQQTSRDGPCLPG